MKKLLFICRGNMFRSPIAEALFNQNPIEGWHAFSYGTAVAQEGREDIKLSQWGKGIQITIDEMKKLGMDISNNSCHQILPEHVQNAEKVIVMSEIDFVPKWLADRNDERWEIPNPDTVSPEEAREIIDMLSRKIKDLKERL